MRYLPVALDLDDGHLEPCSSAYLAGASVVWWSRFPFLLEMGPAFSGMIGRYHLTVQVNGGGPIFVDLGHGATVGMLSEECRYSFTIIQTSDCPRCLFTASNVSTRNAARHRGHNNVSWMRRASFPSRSAVSGSFSSCFT